VIRIDKPKAAPKKLTRDGKTKADSHIDDYNQAPLAYQQNKKSFSFSSNIYGHSSVKAALVLAQHKKCCFCERLVGDDGDVEHFRPKSAYAQKKGSKLNRPGYYWLAYAWDNLYLSCSACNQRQKRNLFPLAEPTTRAHSHSHNISLEEPLFINPGVEDPSKHIAFRGEVSHPVPGSTKGKITIENLNLNRDILLDIRFRHLQNLKRHLDIITIAVTKSEDVEWQAVAAEARQFLRDAISDQGEFAAATRAALKDDLKRFM
jgi:uncharacterized protein (TIGR02646 family)